MPTYCYETKDGTVFERNFPMGKAKRIIMVDGKRARRSLMAELTSVPSTKGWPFECDASGVHPDDAGKLRTLLKKSGVPTDVTQNGNPVYTSARHRRKALAARGLHDNAAYC